MKKKFKHKFVEFIPDEIDESTIYISMEYCTAVHLCVCGCGHEVVTPFSPSDWKLAFNGKNISLSPSIGNWNFECKSHYWIKGNDIIWAGDWSRKQIEDGRRYDRENKSRYFNEEKTEKGKKDVLIKKKKWWKYIIFWL